MSVLLAFPTCPRPQDRYTNGQLGTPEPAKACDCDHPIVDERGSGLCIYCGHYSADTIAQTFGERTRIVAGWDW